MNRRGIMSIVPRIAALAVFAALGAVFAAAQSSAPAASASQRTDGQIESDVVKALDAATPLKNDLITAATINGEVTLSGTVSSQGSKDMAGVIAQGVTGVTAVHNNLTVGNPQQAAEEQGLTQDQNQDDSMIASEPASQPAQNQTPASPSSGEEADAQPPAYPAPAEAEGQAPYPPQYPPARPQYAAPYPPPGYAPQPNGYAPQPAYTMAKGPVTIAAGALIQLRTSEPVDSKRAVSGSPVQFTVIRDVTVGGVLAIPRGATVHGEVTDVKQVQRGQLGGSSELALQLTSLDLGGKTYPIQSDLFKVKGPNKAGQTASSALMGGLLGTIIGCAAGRGAGCAIGAGAGVAAGTAAGAAAQGPRAWIPAEALVDFHLAAPLTVSPVSEQEAARLAQGLYPGGPTLYQRGGPYARYYGPYGYPAYAYPPVYYRPYYVIGGTYYWR